MSSFHSLLSAHAAAIETTLEKALAGAAQAGEIHRPRRLMEAMRHSALNGGKRLRPFLLFEAANLFDVDKIRSLHAGAALELIHCYSLVHDDLPAMDDDDLRRGKPTTHRAYGEATAILAGDALLTLAFDMIADTAVHPDGDVRANLVQLFARSAGPGGMVGGQMLDLEAEGKSLNEASIRRLQTMKTGALMRCACEAGAILGGATSKERAALVKFGTAIGQAFQLVDDILDVTSNAGVLGKNTAKDKHRGKATLVAAGGIEPAKATAQQLLEQAAQQLSPFGNRAGNLVSIAKYAVERDR